MDEKKYYAQIDGERRGPFTLDELADASVGPETYVWCKGMEKWRRADKVADVCRYWRQRLAGALPGQEEPEQSGQPQLPAPAGGKGNIGIGPRGFFGMQSGYDPSQPEPGVNLNDLPRSYLVEAILATVFCMPLTGFVAIYFAIKAISLRKTAGMENDPKLADQAKLDCYYATRSAKMWIGITFFLGIIMAAAIGHFM